MVRLYSMKMNPRSAPAGRVLFTFPDAACFNIQTKDTNMFLFRESPTNPALFTDDKQDEIHGKESQLYGEKIND